MFGSTEVNGITHNRVGKIHQRKSGQVLPKLWPKDENKHCLSVS